MPIVSYWGGLYYLWGYLQTLIFIPSTFFLKHLQALLPFQGQCRYADRCGLLR